MRELVNIRAAKYSDFVRVIGFSKVSSYVTDGYHDLHGLIPKGVAHYVSVRVLT